MGRIAKRAWVTRLLMAAQMVLPATSLLADTGTLVVRVVDQETLRPLPARLMLPRGRPSAG